MVDNHTEGDTPDRASDVGAMLSGAGWGLLVIWIGIVFLVGTPSWVGLPGIGVITLVVQLVRRLQGLPVEGLWVAVGLLCVPGSRLGPVRYDPPLSILRIVAGSALLVSIFAERKKAG